MTTLFTIGYEGMSIDAFLALLARNDIETVVDIREMPLSRKRGFSKNALAHCLSLAGIAYFHRRELGCPRPIRNAYRADGDWQQYAEGFQRYLATQAAAVAALARQADVSRCALLCFEADYRFCHRAMVAAAVGESNGAAVEHLSATARQIRNTSILA